MGEAEGMEGCQATDPKKDRDAGLLWTFERVQERLVDAMRCWWRMPDRESGWQWIKACWPDVPEEKKSLIERHQEEAPPMPRRPPLTRDQIAAMEEASEWLRFVPERDRQIVALALAQLAAGAKQVSWKRVRQAMNAELGTRGLGQRYSRALAGIAKAISKPNARRKGAEIRAGGVSSGVRS